MWAVYYKDEVRALFVDRGDAAEWTNNQVNAYPDDSSFDADRVDWSCHYKSEG